MSNSFVLINCSRACFCLEVDLLPSTPIKIDCLEQVLTHRPDRSFVSFLISGLSKGFHTGIQVIPDRTLQGENLRSARNYRR